MGSKIIFDKKLDHGKHTKNKQFLHERSQTRLPKNKKTLSMNMPMAMLQRIARLFDEHFRSTR